MSLQDLNKLCTPAQLYLFITLFSLVIMIYQNAGTYENVLCVGNYECHNSPNKAVLAVVKLIYIGFWTFVLQMICKGGYKNVSWFLVLLPVILFMLILIFGMGPWTYAGRMVEGMTNLNEANTPKGAANYVSDNVGKVADDVKKRLAAAKQTGNIDRAAHRKAMGVLADRLKNVAVTSASKIK